MSLTHRIRNVAVLGHSGSGKTSLVEAMATHAGLISRMGRVEDGTTLSDTEAEEIAHRISIALSVVPVEWNGHSINLIDTPGDPDFEGEVRAALSAADLALVVVSAVEGVEVGTTTAWNLCDELGLPRLVVINKLDRERASYEQTLADLKAHFGDRVMPLELPIGAEADFHGVADVLSESAYVYPSQPIDSDQPAGVAGGKQEPVPEHLVAVEHRVHDEVVEAIVVGDDELLERFLDGEEPDVEILERTLKHELIDRAVFPVLETSATGLIGIDRLCDYLHEIGPSPADRPGVTIRVDDIEAEIRPDPDGPPLVSVFKTVSDPYVGQISLFKVLSGTVKNDSHLINRRTGADERLHGLFVLQGSQQTPVDQVVAGGIGAVAKLNDTRTGDTLAPKDQPVTVPPIIWPDVVHSVALVPRTQGDEDKLPAAMARMRQEDPVLVLDHDDETHQTILRGTGETHLAIALERLARKFGVEVDTEPVRVAYRETITIAARAEARYKKQSGGHGQFGVVDLEIEPLERGAGFEFVDRVVGGAIPRQFIPAVEKGIVDTMAEGGVLKGYPVVDLRAVCVDGKAHSVDSSEMSFRAAARLALREAMSAAEPVLLEPVSAVVVVVPTDLQGDVMGDLAARRGRVSGTDQAGVDGVAISALVPTAELGRYAVELRSLTAARGRFSAHHAHYDVMPAHLADAVEPR